MTEEQTPEQQAQTLFEQAQQSLQQITDLTYHQHLTAARYVRDNYISRAKIIGIQRAQRDWVKETQPMVDEEISRDNERLANLIVESEANMAEAEESLQLDLSNPSLEDAIHRKRASYGALRAQTGNSLPDDIDDFFADEEDT